MRKLIAWNVMTLDGYFEGANPWAIEFHNLVWGPELQELSASQLKEAGLLLFGRKTYVGMASYWSTSAESEAAGMNSLPKAVVSNTLESADWNNSRLLRGDAIEQVKALKTEEGGPIYVFGSADLLDSLLGARLVDEYRLCIAPVLLGRGNPLFKQADRQQQLELKLSRTVTNGGMLLYYAPKRD